MITERRSATKGTEWEESFPEPKERDEAENRLRLLAAEIRNIEAQLGDRDHRNEFGERMNDTDYWQWRRRAVMVKSIFVNQMSLLKGWLRQRQSMASTDRNDYRVLLVARHQLNDWLIGSMPDEAKVEDSVACIDRILARMQRAGSNYVADQN